MIYFIWQSILNSTANATLQLILNTYVRFQLIDSTFGIEIGRPFAKMAFEDKTSVFFVRLKRFITEAGVVLKN